TPDSLIYKEANEEDTILLVESSMISASHDNLVARANDLESILTGLCKSVKRTKSNINGDQTRKNYTAT
ncbi:MAG: carbon-nitrogen hydrolase family protein, partial [Metallosphaera sp.]